MLDKSKIKISSNRSFGLVFSAVFLIIALWPLTSGFSVLIWAVIVSLVFLILGLLNSKLLTPLNKIWFKFGILLGRIISPLVMGLIFFFVITPIGISLRLFGKDFLDLKKKETGGSYWNMRDSKIEKSQNYEKQF